MVFSIMIAHYIRDYWQKLNIDFIVLPETISTKWTILGKFPHNRSMAVLTVSLFMLWHQAAWLKKEEKRWTILNFDCFRLATLQLVVSAWTLLVLLYWKSVYKLLQVHRGYQLFLGDKLACCVICNEPLPCFRVIPIYTYELNRYHKPIITYKNLLLQCLSKCTPKYPAYSVLRMGSRQHSPCRDGLETRRRLQSLYYHLHGDNFTVKQMLVSTNIQKSLLQAAPVYSNSDIIVSKTCSIR